jgi:hypothetical protein
MIIKNCLYGKNKNYIDVTSIVRTNLQKYGSIMVDNTNFTDPCYGVRKELIINLDNGSNIIVEEGKVYIEQLQSDTPIKLKCYYHIFCTQDPIILQIVDEQLDTIKHSSLYNKFDVINCCVTGNHLQNYNLVLEKLNTRCKESNGKIRIHKSVFGDTSYERFTLKSIKDDPDLNENTYILYIHSKGVTRQDVPVLITKWRKCLMHFLVTKGERCINMFIKQPYDTVGIFHIPQSKDISPDGAYYAGNMWWARGSYLRKLFSKFTIGEKYYDTEQFLFKDNPHFCNLYNWNWNLQPVEEHNYSHI